MNPLKNIKLDAEFNSIELPIPFTDSLKTIMEKKTISIPRILCMNAIEVIPEMKSSTNPEIKRLARNFQDHKYHGEARLIFSAEKVSDLADTFFGRSRRIKKIRGYKEKPIQELGRKIFSFFTESFSLLLKFELDLKVPVTHLERIIEIHRPTSSFKKEGVVLAGFVDFTIGENEATGFLILYLEFDNLVQFLSSALNE